MTEVPLADRVDSILEALWTPGPASGPASSIGSAPVLDSEAQVFAVLDGARLPGLTDLLRRSRLDHRCLLPGKLLPRLARAAPYLVGLGRSSPGSRELVRAALSQKDRRGHPRGAGIFLRSDAVLQELRRHLYGLFQVQDVGGRSYFFRFYDPAVLEAFLPTCTQEELDYFFGPVGSFCVAAPGEASRGSLRRYSWVKGRDGAKLMEEILDLDGAPGAVASGRVVSKNLRGPDPRAAIKSPAAGR